MQRKHNCKYCYKKYLHRSSYLKHLRLVHSDIAHEVTCACGHRFPNNSALADHIKIFHFGLQRNRDIVCPFCPFKAKKIKPKPMYMHLNTNHNFVSNWYEYFFESLNEFEIWKTTLERNTLTSYRMQYISSSARTYTCCLDKPEEGDLGPDKPTSPYKMNLFCPSKLNVYIVSQNSVVVSYLYNHIGHTTKMWPAVSQCVALRGQALHDTGVTNVEGESVPMEVQGSRDTGEINGVGESVAVGGQGSRGTGENNGVGESIERGGQGSRDTGEINGVGESVAMEGQASYRIGQHNGVCEGDEDIHSKEHCLKEKELILKYLQHVTIEQFVTGYLSTSKETMVCTYKPVGACNDVYTNLQKEDFLLVYMSKGQYNVLMKHSKGTVSVDQISGTDFTMFTLSVLNNISEGVPVAHMFTSKVNSDTITVFFESVKAKCGMIYCSNFMSDVAELTYTVWKAVMGEPKTRTLSTWHVLSNWRNSLNRHVANKQKRELMYNDLQCLIREVDPKAFENRLQRFLQCDEETSTFIKLFITDFTVVWQTRIWAHCYGINSTLNNTMSLKGIYRFIGWDDTKSCGTAVVSYLKNIIKAELHLKYVVKSIKQRQWEKSLRENHSKSLSMDVATVIRCVHFTYTEAWTIVSPETDDYFVVQRKGVCFDCFEYKLWSVCCHKYICSCPEYALMNIVCEHIYLVVRAFYTRLRAFQLHNTYEVVSGDAVEVIGDGFIQQSALDLTILGGTSNVVSNEPQSVMERSTIEERDRSASSRDCFQPNISEMELLQFITQQECLNKQCLEYELEILTSLYMVQNKDTCVNWVNDQLLELLKNK